MNEAAVKIENIVNGVNVDNVAGLVGAVSEEPELGKSQFRLTNKWITGGQNQSRISTFFAGGEEHEHLQEFVLQADEPPVLAGIDSGANPVEHLLNALASCLTTTLVYHAAVRGIEIRALEAEVTGNIDLNGFFGLSDDVRRGYQNIRVSYRIDTDDENIEALRELTLLSPVLDTVRNGSEVGLSIEQM